MSTSRFLAVCGLICSLALFADNPKYVFLFIGDGMSSPQRNLAEAFYKKTQGQDKEIIFNHFPVKIPTRTSSANALVTDSAASGTAIACGEKTNNGRIGMSADGTRELESVAYVAKKAGKKVGIVTSVTINHATPAAFYGHRLSRGQYYELGLDLIASNFDYFGGGGCGNNNETKNKAYKGDIYELAKQAGYTVTSTREEFDKLNSSSGKVFARGAAGALSAAIDNNAPIQLYEFVAKGIELLDNPNGFFMMCEGGAIDWRGHANDAAGSVHETIALDKAVRVACNFAAKHPGETLIVVTGDHETGGLTVGFANTGYQDKLELLAKQKGSIDSFNECVRTYQRKFEKAEERTFENCGKPALAEFFSFTFDGDGDLALQPAELESLAAAFARFNQKAPEGTAPDQAKKIESANHNAFKLTAMKIFNKKCGATWSTGSHSALPVITSAMGNGADAFAGDSMENTNVSITLKKLVVK